MHWILAWIDFSQNCIRFFDSIPELDSTSWAEPIFLQILEHIFCLVKKECDYHTWSRKLYSPSPLRRQMDIGSSGLFVLMALSTIKSAERIRDLVGHDRVDEMRRRSINLLLDIPLVRQYNTPATSENEQVADSDTVSQVNSAPVNGQAEQPVAQTEIEPLPLNLPTAKPEQGPDSSMDLKATSIINVDKNENGFSSTSSVLKKRPLESSYNESSDSEISDNEKARTKRHFATKKAKVVRRSPQARFNQLDADRWIVKGSVTPSSVKCAGCLKSIKLSNRQERPHELKNWDCHKEKCPGITGIKVVRTTRTVEVKSDENSKKSALANFFNPKSSQKQSLTTAAVNCSSSASSSNNSNSGKITYHSKVVKVAPPLTNFFARGPVVNEPLQAPPMATDKTPVPCKHLAGSDYKEYIQLITTREFGGISPEFVARVARQLFPYKPFEPLKETDKNHKPRHSQPIDLKIPLLTETQHPPPDGNTEVKRPLWTGAEYRQLEGVMNNWRRWIVDYDNRYIKSSRCTETTTNTDEICDNCTEVSKDESLKRSIRRKRREAAKNSGN
ncbi:hypothetical protein GALMADRAFT_917205 [Galerina marginata CBS 339.88]|uniref:Ubiquitin-like protease family profile domain-containing protein n=1 Tax=Galerina marginata (strain CBS 339.88) TaxID=685588 RepID=A0A067SHX4_GALM3|nr:hypothetical protein GALMADRAFT_917205 [Galerina marginata CBS 339.88]